MSKIITITDELYEKLKAMKKNDKSFSKVIAEVLTQSEKGNRDKVLAMIGKRKKEWEGIDSAKFVRDVRKNWKWDRYV